MRIVADLVRGKKVAQAISTLRFANKRAADPIVKLLESAVANAKNKGVAADNLFVDKITVNGGVIMYRRRPMSRGRAFSIRKRTSNVFVSLSEKGGVTEAETKAAKPAKSHKDKPVKAALTGPVEHTEAHNHAKEVKGETKAQIVKPPKSRKKNK